MPEAPQSPTREARENALNLHMDDEGIDEIRLERMDCTTYNKES